MEHISVKSSINAGAASFTFTSGSEGKDSKLNLNDGYLKTFTNSKIDGTTVAQGLGTTKYAGEAVDTKELFYANIHGQSLVVTPAAAADNKMSTVLLQPDCRLRLILLLVHITQAEIQMIS